ncbi:hypothetical protein chiPu_0002508 [Chiloscyllium punctatum]|uniref:AAA+ ATPase domain-containing protein n=1 Tax=Chiloscyllium punctatum TaxID=137246 RepID=A0A401S153_CHIPU|nr:hypothetical protein [Chiloscyllium punctatum]
MEQDEETHEQEADPRMAFLQSLSLMFFSMKPDKWTKFSGTEENKNLLMDFFNTEDVMILVLYINSVGQLTASLGFPASIKTKGIYFVKKKMVRITPENIRDSLSVGDISNSPVEQLLTVLEEVVCTLFTNTDNMTTWPQVVSEDVVKHAQQLKNDVFVFGGQLKGKALLALPKSADDLEDSDEESDSSTIQVDGATLHAIESVVIDWTHQVKDVLNKDSAQALLDGLNPLPREEIDFWDLRLKDLKCLHEQLWMPKARKISEVLEKSKSSYWPALKSLYDDIRAGLEEASDIVLHLIPLKSLIEDLEQTEYSEVSPYVDIILHTVCLVWANSRYYNTPARIIVILQEIFNLFIHMTCNFLNPEELMKGLQGEIEEVLETIHMTISVLKKLYQVYDHKRSEMHTFFKDREPKYWEFPSHLAFARLDRFMHRLQTIEEIFSTTVEFLKLEKIEVGGVRGNLLGQMVQQIYLEFLEDIKIFADCTYNALDIAEHKFEEDHAVFQRKIDDFDRRLAMIICQGFSDCASILPAVKMLNMFAFFIKRPLIKEEVSQKYPILVDMINNDLDNIKSIFDAHLTAMAEKNVPTINRNMPYVAGELKWAQEVNERMEVSMKCFNSIDYSYTSNDEAKHILNKHTEMKSLLEKFSEQVYTDWIMKVDEDCQFNLKQPLITRNPTTNLISVSFSKKEWSTSPLFERGGNKKDSFLDLDGRQNMLNKRYAAVTEDGVKLHALLEENRILFHADVKDPSWEKYVNYIDEMVVEGFHAVVQKSLQFLLSNMESQAHASPLFEVRLELTESDTEFRPTIGIGSEFYNLIETLMNDVYKFVGLVPRLAKHVTRKKYQIDLEEMTDLTEMREEIMTLVITTMRQAEKYEESFDSYSYLWVDDRNEFLEEFLIYGRVLTQEEIESYGEGGVPPTPPTLEQFKNQIDSYEQLYEEVLKFETVKILDSWFKIDCRPFRQALLNLIKRWSLLFKQYLINHVTDSLSTLEAFIKETNAELSKTVKEGDLKALIQVMGYLKKVKERQVTTDNMFEPLKQTIELLKTYDVEMPEEVHTQLHDLPEQWNNTKKISVICKHAVAPLQANEVNVIRRKCLRFEINQHGFRQKFKVKAPFKFDNPNPYKALDKAQKKIVAMEVELQALAQSAALFEVSVPDCKQLKACRKEIVLLKDLWDMVILVSLTIEDWKTTKWKNISVENMDADCKKFVKDLRSMDKEIRAWDVYSGLDNLIKNTMTSLKAVNFVMSDETTLADLLSLQLHNFEDEVRNIVDKSVKESGMEKVSSWQQKLSTADAVISIWFEVQRTWVHLESIFIGSEDIRMQLPEDSKRFEVIDVDFKVSQHLSKLFDNMAKLKFQLDADNNPMKVGIGMYSKEQEYVPFDKPCDCSGQVEIWLNRLLDRMCATLRHEIAEAVVAYEEKPREQWIFEYPAQIALTGTQIIWNGEVSSTFAKLEEGYENAMKDYLKKQISQLNSLITLLIGNLSVGDRQKIMTICTVEVHARDVVNKMITTKVENIQAFTWQSQLRHRWDDEKQHCFANICDAQFRYSYEYLGNTPRLVITPLTDRPCAMVVPDFELICEIMLVAEGFIDARLLARKFITLYTLCKELLSKQDHYDWGLRAIKSVLVVAGSLKRGDPTRPEDQVLMRALRDFNIPKIVTDDLPVFMGLIGDLFPALDVPRKRDLDFEQVVRQSILELHLQPEDSFVLKVIQLEEILQVRHSVFVVGNAGTGKSQVMLSLKTTYLKMKRKAITIDLDPKAVTCDELFGVINPATREWKDGLFSTIMRDLANISHDGPKWIVLDGDIDPMWIESLNTVMDDNKVLTLASNERIPLNPTMRLLFEISHLRTATPATVSRAGILYINPADLGWNPVVASWIESREVQSEKANLLILFDKYLPTCLEKLRTGFKMITPIPEITMVQTVLHLMECLLTPINTPADSPKELYELYFVFTCVWGFGGTMFQDQLVDYRVEFSKWWVNEFKSVKFPSQGTIFDYYIDSESKRFMPWTDKVPTFELDSDLPLQAAFVHTTETIRLRYFIDLMLEIGRPIMLAGNAGTGKSVLMWEKLNSLNIEDYLIQAVPFNFYTNSAMLQAVLEKPLEKKTGRNFGPPGIKKLIYFIDDMNMPEVDKYGTVAPHTLIRQHLDHGHWYDKVKLTLKDIHNCQYVACMNPTAGSFTIDSRLQDMDESALFQKPNIFCHFASGIGEPKYLPVKNWNSLNKILVEALDGYNEINAVMNLVLFEDAMAHICRINRILESPRGNALLVGVGGSGKQSLSRLAAYISSLNVFQIALKKGYSVADLKVDVGAQYINAGVKNHGTVFLMTDSQVAEEIFLVLINDLLASGEIPGLFQDDELENIIVRARKFPALVNCTSIDWFHEWPEEALVSVSQRFLEETEGIESDVKHSISLFMSFVHKSVQEMSSIYLSTERRYNYTTPKTFLEQIKLYQNLLSKQRKELIAKMDRLENGLAKLNSTAGQVDDLKSKLAIQEVELQQKNEDADKLIKVVGQQTEIVTKNKKIADEEEKKVQIINENVREKQQSCEEDLAKAEPALIAAQEALNTLNKNNLTELKSFGSPPDAVVLVAAAVMILLAPSGKLPKDKSWKAAKVMMGKVDSFLDSLINYDKEHIPDSSLKAFRPILENAMFDPDFIRTKSIAAAGLCSWCINIVKFYEVFCEVEPKRIALAQANAELAAAQEKLAGITRMINELDDNLAKLTAEFEKATSEKLKCQQEADNTNRTISLANRLVGGLVSEKIRWGDSIAKFKEQEKTLCGDVLLVTAFVSYLGYFTKKYRNELLNDHWMPFLQQLEVPIPITENLDPLSLLTDDVDIAAWNNQGLPSDRTSSENATILCNTERWPLIIDAQLQGIKWIKRKYGDDLKVIRLGQRGYLDKIEHAVANGDTLLLENISETVEPVLDALLGRNTIKKGKYIHIGDKEVEYHPNFRMILQTKYFNPHFKPEMQAQCTLINFLVTRDGLEDQLLAAVVAKERPDLEELKARLTTQQNEFKIVLKQLEDSLLARLSEASGNFLGDTALVENLETTKQTATEIEQKVAEAKVTEVKINEARENYRPAAQRASLLYFVIDDLNKINPIYQFSLKAFHVTFEKAIQRSVPADDVKERVLNLTDEITYSVFVYITRGLFERDKLIFTAQVAFQVLAEMEQFKNLDSDIEGSANRWKKIVESEAPEKEKLPQEWKNKGPMEKLCMMRCMRPDRMTYAVSGFVEEKLGAKYVEGRSMEFAKSYEESSPSIPIFFILSPGVDPLKDVEALGKKLGFTIDNGKFHNVSLGQGQEIVAEQALDEAAADGHWVILQDTLEMCSKESEFKCILFALCYFHAVVAERRKFGAQGWNRAYPFNNGDLTISVYVLYNYLEANPKVPWDDLRYLFGEIMYGGHITDDWDRKLCRTYLEEYIKNEMLDGELLLAPGFPIPPNSDYKGYHDYVNEMLPPESPYLYGLHPNAEIGFLTVISEKLFRTVLELQPKESAAESGGGVTREEKVKSVLDEILEKLPESFNMHEIMGKVEERTPYVVVAFQECERTNILTAEIKRSLKELNLGLKGELTITADMEEISNALFFDTVPATWAALAYPSLFSLGAWFSDLLLRIRELEAWSTDFALPSAVWLGGFFNPQSFLTAIMQSMARKNEWPLDKMCLAVEVTKKNREDMTSAPREGAYIHGLFMEGARWEKNSGIITDARLKELTPGMPVVFIKAIPVDRQETKNIYECPVYKTRSRGPTYVWTFNLKTKESRAKWILAGVAVLLQV